MTAVYGPGRVRLRQNVSGLMSGRAGFYEPDLSSTGIVSLLGASVKSNVFGNAGGKQIWAI